MIQHAHPHPVQPFSADHDFDFEIRSVLGHSGEGAADPGEVLAAVSGIRKGDHEAWFGAWKGLGDRVSAAAAVSAEGGHRVSAAEAYLRAATYYGVAVNAVASLPDATELLPTFRRQRAAWEAFVDHAPVAVERVGIPFERGSLPGYLFRPASTTPAATGPAVVAVNGSDGSLAALWASCVSAALKRGYTVLVFDGPGQQSQLFEEDVTFRPDWENVLTPVYTFVSEQPGVDPARIGLYGISQGGYWVARALAFEHRFAAAITDPGVVDVSASWTSQLPKNLLRLLDEGKEHAFDRDLGLALELSPGTARTWTFRARPYGTSGYAETIEAVRAYTVADVAGRITTPLLITSPEHEQFWPGQSAQLAALTPGVSTLAHFTAAEGADGHCQPLARAATAQRLFDWLDSRLAP
jgi:dienelactone hydrolase